MIIEISSTNGYVVLGFILMWTCLFRIFADVDCMYSNSYSTSDTSPQETRQRNSRIFYHSNTLNVICSSLRASTPWWL
jgi:hypothetical protein